MHCNGQFWLRIVLQNRVNARVKHDKAQFDTFYVYPTRYIGRITWQSNEQVGDLGATIQLLHL